MKYLKIPKRNNGKHLLLNAANAANWNKMKMKKKLANIVCN
jgi:hypothetical protein